MSSAQSQHRLLFGQTMTFRQLVARCSLVVGLTMLLMASAGCGGAADSTETAKTTALPVDTAVAEPVRSFVQRRTFTGVVKASRSSELGFERTGRLVAVDVQDGDRVTQDQVLARLDSENLKARQRELTAQRAAAQSLLDELQAGPRKETIAAARADVRDLQSQVELAQLTFRRREQLLKSQAISQEDYDQTALGLKSTAAKLDAAQRRLDELEAGTRAEKIDAQRAAVDQLDAALANTAVDIEESTLVAPYAGMISKRYLDEGAIVSPGAPLVRLVEDERLEAWIGFPAAIASQLEVDSAVDVVVDHQTYKATVSAVLPELDPATRTRTAIFALAATSGVFPAQIVRTEIEDTVEAEGFWVPTPALARGSRGLWSVLVVEQDSATDQSIAAKRDVEALHTDGERVLVRGMLEAGDRVIVGGTHRIVAGQRVTTSQLAQVP